MTLHEKVLIFVNNAGPGSAEPHFVLCYHCLQAAQCIAGTNAAHKLLGQQ